MDPLGRALGTMIEVLEHSDKRKHSHNNHLTMAEFHICEIQYFLKSREISFIISCKIQVKIQTEICFVLFCFVFFKGGHVTYLK